MSLPEAGAGGEHGFGGKDVFLQFVELPFDAPCGWGENW